MNKVLQRNYIKSERNDFYKRKHGFTLVELIVSMALFTIVVFITTSAFLTLTSLYNKAQTTRTALDNLNIVIEHIVREIRTGTTYHCGVGSSPDNLYNVYSASGLSSYVSSGFVPKNCDFLSGGSRRIAFKSSDGGFLMYRLCMNSSECSGVTNPTIKRFRTFGNDTNELTSSDIDITSLRFYVFNAEGGNNNQPRVSIIISGTVGTNSNTRTSFNAYSSATQRAPK